MKIIWSTDRQSIVLIAETRADIAFCDIISADTNGHKYAQTAFGARYTIIPEEQKEVAKK